MEQCGCFDYTVPADVSLDAFDGIDSSKSASNCYNDSVFEYGNCAMLVLLLDSTGKFRIHALWVLATGVIVTVIFFKVGCTGYTGPSARMQALADSTVFDQKLNLQTVGQDCCDLSFWWWKLISAVACSFIVLGPPFVPTFLLSAWYLCDMNAWCNKCKP